MGYGLDARGRSINLSPDRERLAAAIVEAVRDFTKGGPDADDLDHGPDPEHGHNAPRQGRGPEGEEDRGRAGDPSGQAERAGSSGHRTGHSAVEPDAAGTCGQTSPAGSPSGPS